MNPFVLYFDKDALRSALVKALRSRDLAVVTASEAGDDEASDEGHLVYAAARDYVVYTFNASDFYRLHTEWLSEGRQHAGIILGQQQRYSVGEQMRRIMKLRTAVPPRT